jgi:hypothetical protein
MLSALCCGLIATRSNLVDGRSADPFATVSWFTDFFYDTKHSYDLDIGAGPLRMRTTMTTDAGVGDGRSTSRRRTWCRGTLGPGLAARPASLRGCGRMSPGRMSGRVTGGTRCLVSCGVEGEFAYVVPLLTALQVGAHRFPGVALCGVTVEAGEAGDHTSDDPPRRVHEASWCGWYGCRARPRCGIVGHRCSSVASPRHGMCAAVGLCSDIPHTQLPDDYSSVKPPQGNHRDFPCPSAPTSHPPTSAARISNRRDGRTVRARRELSAARVRLAQIRLNVLLDRKGRV